MNVFLLLSSVALVGVGVLGIICAALSLGLRLPGIRPFRQSIIAMGSAFGLSFSYAASWSRIACWVAH
jgi:hypothetical protein